MSSDEKALKRQLRNQKELTRLQKEKARPKNKAYFWYLLLILTLIYIIDEVTTNVPNQIQSSIISAFFGSNGTDYDSGLKALKILGIIAIALMIPSCFYKPLADRYGRKIFLFINTFGMGIAMSVCFLSRYLIGTKSAFIIYAIGFVLMRWFVTPDEQVVYIFETSPKKWRATIYSIIKGIAEFGLFLIPWFRNLFITSVNGAAGFTCIFLTIAIIGFVISFLALFFARETDAFLDERIAYLSLSEEEKKALAEQKLNNKKQQGGLITGLVYALKDKQLRWIFIATVLYTAARVVSDDYESIMTLAWTVENDSDANKLAAEALVTSVEFYLPLGAGLLTIAYGFLSDLWGRKKTSILLLSSCLVFFSLFLVSVKYQWNSALIGISLGLYLAAYWGTGDTYIMMAGESAPTNLRASIMAAQSAFYGMGQGLSMGLSAILLGIFPTAKNHDNLWIICLSIAVPCFILSLSFLMLKVKETRGIGLEENGAKKD